MSGIPVWIQVLQALLTPAIAVGVATIAFMQWRTAHQKVVLDLFEKRLQVYQLVREAVSSVVTSGHAKNEASITLAEAAEGATFLFNQDIQDYIETLWRDFSRLNSANAALENGGGQGAADARTAAFERIQGFYLTGPKVFGTYMRMHQQIVRTPSDWLNDRNQVRLSYADEKQK